MVAKPAITNERAPEREWACLERELPPGHICNTNDLAHVVDISYARIQRTGSAQDAKGDQP